MAPTATIEERISRPITKSDQIAMFGELENMPELIEAFNSDSGINYNSMLFESALYYCKAVELEFKNKKLIVLEVDDKKLNFPYGENFLSKNGEIKGKYWECCGKGFIFPYEGSLSKPEIGKDYYMNRIDSMGKRKS